MIARRVELAYEFSDDSDSRAFNGSQDAGTEDGQMTIITREVKQARLFVILFLTAGLFVASSSARAVETGAERRLSVTTQNTKAQREAGAAGVLSEDEFDALVKDGKRPGGSRSSSSSKTAPQGSLSPNNDFWFYSADVLLFNDHDRDGYYHGIDLLFDADTYYAVADVYAVVYLSLDGGPWNEYAATEDFTLFGATSDDEYVLVTELLAGYPTGSYDILIELFDAYDDTFVAWFGPEDTSELAFLPLEDADRDVAVVPDVIVVDRRGGGSTGWLLIAALGVTALARGSVVRRGRCA